MRALRLGLTAFALVSGVGALSAQEPMPSHPHSEDVRRLVRERFAQRVQGELRLTPDQMQRLRLTVSDFGGRRRDLESRQRELREALAGQLRPGIAAQPDSVARLTDALLDARVRYAESFRTEQRELARYLDPVQRAKLMLLRDRLLHRAESWRARRPLMERGPALR